MALLRSNVFANKNSNSLDYLLHIESFPVTKGHVYSGPPRLACLHLLCYNEIMSGVNAAKRGSIPN